ncbi:hypothetical protein MJN76_30350, partial [Salmonella enterica subsp. enterica serovar Anatum]|nr:hypothetical protein [Salmonella enterica subsp. enterica serovar Anatum]
VTSWLASDIHWIPTTPMAELVAISVPPQTERKHIILDNDSPETFIAYGICAFFSSQAIKRANANCEATGVIFIDSPGAHPPTQLA